MSTKDEQFLQWVREQIPLTQAMQIEALAFDGQTLRLSAPLAPNVNDKGTGFGGSIVTLATLAGWALTTLVLKDHQINAEVVIAKSEIHYYKPITSRFTAQVSCELSVVEAMLARIDERGRGKLPLEIFVFDEPDSQSDTPSEEQLKQSINSDAAVKLDALYVGYLAKV